MNESVSQRVCVFEPERQADKDRKTCGGCYKIPPNNRMTEMFYCYCEGEGRSQKEEKIIIRGHVSFIFYFLHPALAKPKDCSRSNNICIICAYIF